MSIKQKSPVSHDFEAINDIAPVAGRIMPQGPERVEELQVAERLRNAADVYDIIFAKHGSPAK